MVMVKAIDVSIISKQDTKTGRVAPMKERVQFSYPFSK